MASESLKIKNKRLFSWRHGGGQVFIVLVMLLSFYYAVTSAFGMHHNPFMIYSSKIIGWFLNSESMPVTFQDAKALLNFDDSLVTWTFILAITYVFLMIFVQVYFYTWIAGYVATFLEKEIMVATLGKQFHQRYCGVTKIRNSKVLNEVKRESDLEEASRKHWEAWKKHYKSNMGYDEWIARIKKAF